MDLLGQKDLLDLPRLLYQPYRFHLVHLEYPVDLEHLAYRAFHHHHLHRVYQFHLVHPFFRFHRYDLSHLAYPNHLEDQGYLFHQVCLFLLGLLLSQFHRPYHFPQEYQQTLEHR